MHSPPTSFNAWVTDTTKKIFQILKQIIVTVHHVISVCKVILLCEARVMHNLPGDCRLVGLTAVPDFWGEHMGLAPRPPHIRGPRVTSNKTCLVLYQHN